MAAALGMKELTEDYQLFQALDADKSGQLDQDELRSLAKGLRQADKFQTCGFMFSFPKNLGTKSSVRALLQGSSPPPSGGGASLEEV